MLRHGKLRRAHRVALTMLEKSPDDADLHALYGAILQKGNRDAEAVVAFGFATGSEWYEVKGLPMHALALARTGRSDEAARLRSEFENAGRRMAAASLGVRVAQSEGHILGGHPDKATEFAEQAVEEFPASPTAFAALTEAYAAAGDLDNATWALIRGEALGATGSTNSRMARMRWHMAMGEYQEAWEISEEFRRNRMFDVRFWGDRARLQRLMGNPIACLQIAQLERFQWGLPVPILLEGSRCAEELGELELARSLVSELTVGYEANPLVVARLSELGVVSGP